MRIVRVVLGLFALVVVVVTWHQLAVEGVLGFPVQEKLIVTAAGVIATFSGLFVWQLRPGRPTGPLLTLAGFGVLLGALGGLGDDRFLVVGSLAWVCLPLVVGHLLLSYPDGLRRGWRAAVVGACWVVPAALGVAMLLTGESWQPARLFPYAGFRIRVMPLAVIDRPDWARWLAVAWSCWVGTLSVLIAVLALVRAYRSRRALRISLAPVAWAGLVWAGALVGSYFFTIHQLSDLSTEPMFELMGFASTIVPAAAVGLVAGVILWVEVLRPRLQPGRDGRIVLPGEALAAGETLRNQLAKAVGDPSLRLAFRTSDDTWVDTHGRPTELRDDRDRAVTTLLSDHHAVAALEHHASLRNTPDLLVVAATVAGLAIDNDRLRALNAAQLEQTRQSAAALLDAGERATRQLEAIVISGPAAKLDALAANAHRGDDPIRLQRALRDVAAQVRTISHGLYPTELEEAGLSAALDQAVEVPNGRYPSAIELTAYLAARDRTEARLVESGDALKITVSGGIGDLVAARVAALDGDIRVDGGFTAVTIPIPG